MTHEFYAAKWRKIYGFGDLKLGLAASEARRKEEGFPKSEIHFSLAGQHDFLRRHGEKDWRGNLKETFATAVLRTAHRVIGDNNRIKISFIPSVSNKGNGDKLVFMQVAPEE